jgi:hypothetical protein
MRDIMMMMMSGMVANRNRKIKGEEKMKVKLGRLYRCDLCQNI